MRWALLLSLLVSACALAEPVVVEIDPGKTGPGIKQATSPHLAIHDNEATSNGLTLISLGGTNSKTRELLEFDKLAASLGYRVLAVDYPNSVITTDCNTDKDFLAFRQEIVEGRPVSELVQVDEANCIENRLKSALDYLGWDEDWSRIVVVGHSQGAGHAAYLGKLHPLQAVLMLAGPQDSTATGPAEWLKKPGATAPSRFWGFLHKQDPFSCDKQMEAIRALRISSGPSMLLTEKSVPDPHTGLLLPVFREQWEALLTKGEAQERQ